ncbi:hypothetical protein AUN14_09965 [Cronobacter muytjensii]|uniref:Uncharacterized protein n=1 Tax=Cronobacter muytjensii TaxID=413501 RepID=A0A2T7AT39_9ENTR|nr:hypothetical protein AUN14_09965 [Cronobacter muytjensii]
MIRRAPLTGEKKKVRYVNSEKKREAQPCRFRVAQRHYVNAMRRLRIRHAGQVRMGPGEQRQMAGFRIKM